MCTYVHISKGRNSLKNYSIDQIVFLQVQDIPIKFFFVLCVVFKCQYFWSYSRKTHFLPFIYIFQRDVTHSRFVRLTRVFFYRFRTFQVSYFVLESYRFLKTNKRKYKKTEFLGGHIGCLVAILD